jgi:hypothetical protein
MSAAFHGGTAYPESQDPEPRPSDNPGEQKDYELFMMREAFVKRMRELKAHICDECAELHEDLRKAVRSFDLHRVPVEYTALRVRELQRKGILDEFGGELFWFSLYCNLK